MRRPGLRSIVLRRIVLVPFLVAASGAPAPGAETPRADPTKRCRDHDPERNVYWGDLHVHTSWSMDAYVFDTRLTPDDAYRFARGEPVRLPPLDAAGRGTRRFALERPLDFAAVTDHAHSFGGVRLCTDPESDLYAEEVCRRYRGASSSGEADPESRVKDIMARIDSLRSEAVCGPDGARCREAAREMWQDTQGAAARWNDTSAQCRFSTFVAYEYTLTPDMTKIHRNVIFRNDRVPELPIDAFREPTPAGLWRALDRECIQGLPGCDVLAIPHNPNLSNGRMFTIETPEGSTREEERRLARLRARMEPVVEMMQIKGESECADGLWKVLGADEDCGFEKVRAGQDVRDCRGEVGEGALLGRGCRSRLDYVRYALIEGLRQADRIGVNPFAFGLVASTDIHTGTPGAVDEWATETFEQVSGPGYNLGGLAAVWAEENSRDAIFEALRRREVYGTSGPRMTVRLFGGWSYPEDLCRSGEFVSQGYARGVPMGSELPSRPADAPPVFAIWAMQDPGTADRPGRPLDRLQIVKGWSDPDGTFHQRVVDVAGAAAREPGGAADEDGHGPGETADEDGHGQLCSVWRDPDFDPEQRAVYYARVLQQPTPRFSTRLCRSSARDGEREDEGTGASGGGREAGDAARPSFCDAPDLPRSIQERAWTSPIWYSP